MAIKGKSKSRGAKAVTPGPKPAYVQVKTPLLRRRGLWIGLGVVLGAAAIAALAVGLVRQRDANREEDRLARMSDAVDEYARTIEPILATVGNSAPPTGFSSFPGLAAAVGGLEAEDVNQKALDDAATAAESTGSAAESAAELFREVDATEFVRGRELPPEFVLYVLNSHDGFVRALDLYRQAALLTAMATEAEEGPAREELVARARAVHDLAAETFAQAYADYFEAQFAAGRVQNPAAAVPTLPTLTGATGTS